MRLHRQSGRAMVVMFLAMHVCAITCISIKAFAQSTQAPSSSSAENPTEKPIVLDKVIAIINGDVLLESDVREEMRLSILQPISVPAGQNTPQRAAQRLISRTLILRQMRDQDSNSYSVTDDEVTKSLAELRQQLPGCREMRCTTEEGWRAFLEKNGLTVDEVNERWHQRLEILKFIDARFGVSIQISKQEIADYYQKNVLPALEKTKQTPPSLDSVAPRIREILLQQQVNAQLRDWLQSLRQQGNVQILDPIYGQSGGSDDDSGGGV